MTKGLKTGIIVGSILLVCGVAFVIYKWRSHTSDSHLSVIPINASAVLKIDIKALAVKADPMKLMQLPAFKKQSSSGSLQDLISNPFSTGIDPIENVYGFVATEGETSVAAIVFNVDDAEKLKEFENKLHIATSETIVESGIYYSPISETECIAWNSDAGIIIATKEGEAKEIAIKYLNQSTSNSILSNSDYETFANKSFDIGVFFNNTELAKMSGSAKSLSSLGISDGYGEILVSFEKNKIEANYQNFSKSPSKPVLKKNGPDPKQFQAISPTPPLMYLGLSADIEELFVSLKNDPTLSDYLAGLEMGMGMNEKDLKKIFSGDLSVSFTDFKDISEYDPRIKKEVEKMLALNDGSERSDFKLNAPLCYVSIGETDDDKMNELLAQSGMNKIDGFYAMPGIAYIVYVAAKDGHMLITNDYFAAQQVSLTGKLSGILPTEISKTNAFSFYTDLNQSHFPTSLTETLKELYGQQEMEFYFSFLRPFKNIEMSGKENSSVMTIGIEPGEGNSLYRIISFYGSMMK